MASIDIQGFVADLAAKHDRRLRLYLSNRLRNVADAPDLVQEVYLRLLRVSRHDSIRNPEAYLLTVASHVLQQYMLREASGFGHRVDVEELESKEDSQAGDPQDSVDARQRLERMDGRLAQLSPRARAAFIMNRRDGYTLDEIASKLGVSRSMVKKYMAQALLCSQVNMEKDLMERER
ncbi:MAG: RNA polymerase sigma factor [Steroidobacteraceae bacterium]